MPVPTIDTPDGDDIHEGRYADLLPDMDESEFERLKTSMAKHGFDEATPIVVTRDGEIVDGHHRYRAAQAVGVEPAIRVNDDVDVEQAIRTNLARRDHDNKRDIVVGWLLSDRYTGDRSQREVAEELGVGRSTVTRAMEEAFPERYEDDEEDESVPAGTPDGVDHSRVSDTSTNKGSAESGSTDETDTPVSDSGEELTGVAESNNTDGSADATPSVSGPGHDVSGPDETGGRDPSVSETPSDGAEAFDDVEQLVGDGDPSPGPDIVTIDKAAEQIDDALVTLDRVEGELPENPPTWFYDIRTYLERAQEALSEVDR